MHVLRAEKGFIIVGQDTDGSMTPMDVNMNWILAKNKPFSYIGRRSFSISALKSEDRLQLVGLLTKDDQVVLPEGAHIINNKGVSVGYVTSSYYSPNLKRSIALAIVRGGKNMMGKKLFIPMEDKIINVTVANPIFFDIENKRLNA